MWFSAYLVAHVCVCGDNVRGGEMDSTLHCRFLLIEFVGKLFSSVEMSIFKKVDVETRKAFNPMGNCQPLTCLSIFALMNGDICESIGREFKQFVKLLSTPSIDCADLSCLFFFFSLTR